MDAQSRFNIQMDPSLESKLLADSSLALGFDDDDGFPADLSTESECRLTQLCDELFTELDSEAPDLRAMERYQAACDELALRRITSGVA